VKKINPHYTRLVDEWAIYDASKLSPRLLEVGAHPDTPQLKEDAAPYSKPDRPQRPHDHSEFITGVEAALRRASDKAIAQALAAGLEPVVAKQDERAPEQEIHGN
jgi:hypothetical protein